MKKPMTPKEFFRGLIVGILALALIFGGDILYTNLTKPKPVEGDTEAAGDYIPGTYTASDFGFAGPVSVAVTVGENGGISEVTVDGPEETPDVGGEALEPLRGQILSAQSAQIDGVSGATMTSNGVKAAAAIALAEASGEEIVSDIPTPEGDDLFVPGAYTGTAMGFGGEITVTATVSENEITDVQVEGDKETANIGSFAVDLLGDEILEAQTVNLDAISGATVSSNAVLRAASQALMASGADLSRLPQKEEGEEEITEEEMDCEILIIGAGGAGMTAAINAAQADKDVILLEKMPYPGGNTTRATSGMNAAETHYQKEQGIEDTVEQFIEDTMEGGHELNDIDLVTVLAENSAAGIDWLDSIGAPLPKISAMGGSTYPRVHAPEDGSGVGAYLVTAFRNQLEEQGVNVFYETKATELLTDEDEAVIGAKAEAYGVEYTIYARAVILATGGFGANEDMYTSYREDLEGVVTTNAPGATGDGIVMAEAVGADLVDMDQIQLHPTVEQSTSMLIAESVRGNGAILVNQEGKRFTNEMGTRDVVSAAEQAQEGGYAYVIFDQNLRDNLAAVEKYITIGIVTEGATIEELAEKLEIDPAVLSETLSTWNQAVADQKDEEFGRDTAMDNDLSTAPYYAIKIAPGIHHTMGGVKINTNAEVINTDGDVIPGLYAAGEVTGGIHGGNRLGGNAVADIVVFGKVASDSAVAYCENE